MATAAIFDKRSATPHPLREAAPSGRGSQTPRAAPYPKEDA